VPLGSRVQQLASAMGALRKGGSDNFVIDVIAAQCSCTQRLFDHLLARGPLLSAEELILFVGADDAKAQAARRAGFRFKSITAEGLNAQYGLEAAPIFVQMDTRNRLRYLGGYYNHPAAIVALDENISAKIESGEAVPPLPIFGCVVRARSSAGESDPDRKIATHAQVPD